MSFVLVVTTCVGGAYCSSNIPIKGGCSRCHNGALQLKLGIALCLGCAACWHWGVCAYPHGHNITSCPIGIAGSIGYP